MFMFSSFGGRQPGWESWGCGGDLRDWVWGVGGGGGGGTGCLHYSENFLPSKKQHESNGICFTRASASATSNRA